MPTCICPIIGCKAHKGRHDTCIGCGRTQRMTMSRGCPWCREKRLEAVKEPTHDDQLTPTEEVMIDTAREKEWELEDKEKDEPRNKFNPREDGYVSQEFGR